jgi:hypothetical protein
MPIKEMVLFAYATKGEALEIANHTVEETVVAEITIMCDGLIIAEKPVAFVVLPAKHYPE